MSGSSGRAYHRRQQPMLFLEHACRQRFRRIVFAHGDPGLRQDRAAVVFLVHKVHRGAGFGSAARQDRLVHPATVHPAPAEGGEEGGMNIHDSAAIRRDDFARNQAYVAGEYEQLNIVRGQRAQPFRGPIGFGETHRANTARLRQFQGGCIGSVTQNEGDPDLGIVLGGAAERLEVAASAGDRYGNLHGHREKVILHPARA